MSERMWGLYNAVDYLCAVRRTRSECIEEAVGFFYPRLTWRQLKRRHSLRVARVVVTEEATHA